VILSAAKAYLATPWSFEMAKIKVRVYTLAQRFLAQTFDTLAQPRWGAHQTFVFSKQWEAVFADGSFVWFDGESYREGQHPHRCWLINLECFRPLPFTKAFTPDRQIAN
jgi:hypothetical protein